MNFAAHSTVPHPLEIEPNRQGYLILGPCVSVPRSPLEQCPDETVVPSYGVRRCRCVKRRYQIITRESGTTSLQPHDRVRISIQVRVLCDL